MKKYVAEAFVVTLLVAAANAAAFGGAFEKEHVDGEPTVKHDAASAVFVESVYRAVLSGDPDACKLFTSKGEADFVADMYPAKDCAEAVDVLATAVHDADEHVASMTFETVAEDDDAATVRVTTGGGLPQLMSLSKAHGMWRAGPTQSVDAR